jgi:hypothetical protein
MDFAHVEAIGWSKKSLVFFRSTLHSLDELLTIIAWTYHHGGIGESTFDGFRIAKPFEPFETSGRKAKHVGSVF